MKEQVLWRCFERRLMGRALTGDVLCDVRGPLRRDRGLHGLVYEGAAEEEGQDRRGAPTSPRCLPGSDSRNVVGERRFSAALRARSAPARWPPGAVGT